MLNVDSNSIHALPEQIGALMKLERLQAASNALISLPGSFARLQALKVLNLARNKFATVPDEIGACSRLEELDLSDNCLQVIAEHHCIACCVRPFPTAPSSCQSYAKCTIDNLQERCGDQHSDCLELGRQLVAPHSVAIYMKLELLEAQAVLPILNNTPGAVDSRACLQHAYSVRRSCPSRWGG